MAATPPPRRRRPPPPPPRHHRPVPRAPTPSRWGRRLGVLGSLPLVAVLGTVALRAVYLDRALPGTQLAGANVEGDSRGALRDRMARLAASPVTVVAGGQQLGVTPAAVGYVQDVPATVDKVLAAGRHGPLLGLPATAAGLLATREVAPVDRVNAAALDATTRRVARLVDRTVFLGGIAVDPTSLAVTVQAPRQGRVVDRPRLARELVAALRSGRSTLRAPLRSSRVASPGAVQRVGQAARRYLRASLTLTGAGAPISVSRARLATLLRLRASGADHAQVRLGGDEGQLVALIAGIAATRDHPAREPRFDAAGRSAILDGKGAATWTARPVAVRITRPGLSGRTIDRGRALAAIADAIRTGQHRASLPLRTDAPTGAAVAQRIRALIGTFTTRYQKAQPRVTNIRTMARIVDGTLIAPGAPFSLNAVAGRWTRQRGYVAAPPTGEGDRSVPPVGGGVSQFATTMYNAAYFAGLRIDAHRPHRLYVARYPLGRDATLADPGVDLRWTNDTSVPILVRTFSDDHSVTVNLYGDDGGRRVTATPGPRLSLPGGDFQVKVVRTVRHRDGHTTTDAFTTRYAKAAG